MLIWVTLYLSLLFHYFVYSYNNNRLAYFLMNIAIMWNNCFPIIVLQLCSGLFLVVYFITCFQISWSKHTKKLDKSRDTSISWIRLNLYSNLWRVNIFKILSFQSRKVVYLSIYSVHLKNFLSIFKAFYIDVCAAFVKFILLHDMLEVTEKWYF